MSNRIYKYDPSGNVIGWSLDGPKTTGQSKLEAQRYWIEYKEACVALGLPVLWESPFADREALDLKRQLNGGRMPRRTKLQIERDRAGEPRKRFRSPNKRKAVS